MNRRRGMLRIAIRFAGTSVFLLCTRPAEAQDVISLENCRTSAKLDMELVQSIAGMGELQSVAGDETPRIGDSEAYARDSRGRVFTSYFGSPGIVSVFGPSGALVATLRGEDFESGASGIDGPLGILSGIVVTPGDTVHAFDRSAMTHWTFSPSLQLVRRSPLPGQPHWGSQVYMSSGRWVISADIPTETEVGWPLHLISSDGNTAASFGTETRIYRQDLPTLVQRVIASAGEAGVWAARVNEYRIELWDPGNLLRRTLIRDLPWFRPWTNQRRVGPEVPRHPHVQDLAVDDSGNLWLLVVKASDRYREYVREYRPEAYTWSSAAGYSASVLEVIDPAAGCVVGTLETEAYLKRSLGDGMYAAYDHREGTPYLDIWHVRVEGR